VGIYFDGRTNNEFVLGEVSLSVMKIHQKGIKQPILDF